MQTRNGVFNAGERGRGAFTLVEVMIATSLLTVMVVSMYSGISFGFTSINVARQKLRATQIALEKMEIIRMCSWSQLNSNGFIPLTFTAPFFPSANPNNPNGGMTYYGRTTITNAVANGAYNDQMRLVTVEVMWTNANVAQRLEMSTYCSQYGMQRYIY